MEVIYRSFDKEFKSREEALAYEQSVIQEKCKFKIGDIVFFLDRIECRLMKSVVNKIWLNEFDGELYAEVKEYDGALRVSDLYNQLPPLIYDLRQNLYEVTADEAATDDTGDDNKQTGHPKESTGVPTVHTGGSSGQPGQPVKATGIPVESDSTAVEETTAVVETASDSTAVESNDKTSTDEENALF